MKILCLFVRHGTEKYPDSLAVLNRWYESQGLIAQRTLWIIDNALAATRCPEVVGNGDLLRAGNNHSWEFSAWDQALRQIAGRIEKYDIIHFVTSAFNTLYTGYLDHFCGDMLQYAIDRNACLGHIDGYKQPMQLDGIVSGAWVRTCFFFLPQTAIPKLPGWATYSNPARFFTAPESREFRTEAPLSSEYQAQIKAWLEGQEIGGHSWHSPVRPGVEENVRFQRKTLAILNEHRLAISFRDAGTKLVDFCWLFSFRHAPLSTAPDPPPESDQMALRRQILGFQEQPESK